MKLNNVRQIRAEDYPSEFNQLIAGLGSILNNFMEEVVELSDKRIDFDNKVENLITFNITVDENGTPTQTPFRVNVGKERVLGTQVILARNNTNSLGFPTSQPFISFVPQAGTFILIQNVSGLLPNERYTLTVIVF